MCLRDFWNIVTWILQFYTAYMRLTHSHYTPGTVSRKASTFFKKQSCKTTSSSRYPLYAVAQIYCLRPVQHTTTTGALHFKVQIGSCVAVELSAVALLQGNAHKRSIKERQTPIISLASWHNLNLYIENACITPHL